MNKLIWSLAMAGMCVCATAQNYPAKPVRVIVPFAPGGGTDISARQFAQKLSEAFKQQFVIDNRGGAGGMIGIEMAVKSPPDGYTLMIGTNATHAANSFLYTNPGFDPQADFEPIAMVGMLPLVYVTAPNNPVNNIQDLVRAAKARPDALNTAVSTTTCRMAHELFKQRAEAPMFPVDFKGSGQAITALLGGHIEYMVDTITSLRAQIASGQVKALGVTSASSSKLLPGVKSIAEQGIAGYELVGWTVIYAPKGLPPEAGRTLTAALVKMLERPDVQEKLLQMGIDPLARTGSDLKTFLAAEKDKWGVLIKGAGLKPS